MTFPQRIIILLLVFTSVIGYAQENLSLKIDSIRTFEDAKERVNAFEKLLTQIDTTQNTVVIGTLFHETGKSYDKVKQHEKAIFYLKKAIVSKKQFNDKSSLNKSYYALSYVYEQQEDIKKASDLLLSIITASGNDRFTCNAYRKLAVFETDNGDFYKALEYLNDGIANKELCKNYTFKSQLSETSILVYATMYESRIGVETKSTDLEVVESHQKIIEENISIVAKNQYNLAAIYNNLAIVYDCFGQLNTALVYYKKAQAIYKEMEDLLYELDVVLNIGFIYSRQKKYALANQYYQRVIDESDDVEQIANAYNSIGYHSNMLKIVEKSPYLKNAIQTILEKNINTDFQLPTLAEIITSEYEQDVLIYLIDLADHYVQAFEEENDTSYLLKAKETVVLIDQLVSLIRYGTETEASKLFWIEKGVNTYMLAVEICYHLNDTEKAFYFMEKNKSLLLQENIKNLQARLMSNIPSKLLEREYKLYYDLSALQNTFQLHVENEEFKERYALKNKEYQTFMDSMKRVFPNYIKTKQNVSITPLTTVITDFQAKETAFVEYILHETDGYGIYYDSEVPIFFKIMDVPKFQQNLEMLKKYMTKRVMNPTELKAYQGIGYAVFQQLFPFENAAERLNGKKITIITDQTLQYIPFEILPTQPSGELSEVYFINTTETSYLQSFSLFEQIKQKKNSPTQKLLAIAPYEFENSTLPTLTGTEEVLEFLSKYEASTLLTKKEASKANFLKHRNDFEIIHLNTHAGLDNSTQTPWIAFNEEEMSLNELFGLENQADLVILDACKTNDGVHLSGEGLINLSRGFFYNGTQSVLASQWNVNEEAGNEIIQEFYTEIEKGTSKSKALQLAKKAYLQNHDRVQNSPYYWAAFTLTGSTNAVSLQPMQNYTYIFVGIAILAFLALFFYYRKKISA